MVMWLEPFHAAGINACAVVGFGNKCCGVYYILLCCMSLRDHGKHLSWLLANPWEPAH